jgi:UDP-N-acetylglucosamine transferase subunit ALG13
MVVQYGRGKPLPPAFEVLGFHISSFGLQPSLAEYISNSKLVIGHGGKCLLPTSSTNGSSCLRARISFVTVRWIGCFQAHDIVGAGTVVDVLSRNKKLVVVINEDLMDNHQTDLGERLARDGHLVTTTCRCVR